MTLAAAHAPIVSLHGLRFGYTRSAALVLHDLDLAISPGAVTAILGPNGCGKTTLLQILLGRLQPLAGEVRLAGRTASAIPRRELSQLIGLVAQEEEVPFEFTVLEYVVLGRAPYLDWLSMPSAEDYQVAAAAIAQIGIAALQHRIVTTLSGGERQLVRLARALAQQPSILLLDEPTNHLDLSNRGHVLRILRALAAAGTAVIFTTHDAAAAASVAEQAILMREGRVVDAGAVEQVFTDANLSAVYRTPIRVRRVEGQLVILTA
jgi:iron complex transport system ATP-binding protein